MSLSTLNIVTFAWVRTLSNEPEFAVESAATTAGELLDELIATRPAWAALADRKAAIRCAIDQTFAEPQTRIAGAKEVAFFPPVTGG